MNDDQRRLELRLLEQQLGKAEAVMREILARLQCPPDPAALEAVLRDPRVPLTIAERRQVREVLQSLVLLGKVRQHVRLGNENAARAAHDAFLAGLLASEATRHALKRQTMRAIGLASGEVRNQQRRQLRRAVHVYRQSHPDDTATEIARALKDYENPDNKAPEHSLTKRIRRLINKT
jgi:hypothetical protein